MRTWLGRVLREVRRKISVPDGVLSVLLDLCERLHAQQPSDRKKLYSLHEPDVQCISKDKARQRYEFGQKVAFSTTNRGTWIVGVKVFPSNPFDGHTLASTIDTVEKTTGVEIEAVFVDKGYRGHDYQGAANVHIAGTTNNGVTKTTARRRRRRRAIEPKIGHMKSENRLGRCYLKRSSGDRIYPVLAATGSNLLGSSCLGRLRLR